jgi:hypothetical protein
MQYVFWKKLPGGAKDDANEILEESPRRSGMPEFWKRGCHDSVTKRARMVP